MKIIDKEHTHTHTHTHTLSSSLTLNLMGLGSMECWVPNPSSVGGVMKVTLGSSKAGVIRGGTVVPAVKMRVEYGRWSKIEYNMVGKGELEGRVG